MLWYNCIICWFRFLTGFPGLRYRDGRCRVYCNRALGLDQTYLGCTNGMDTDGLQAQSHFPNTLFSVLLYNQAFFTMVLQTSTHCRQQGCLLGI